MSTSEDTLILSNARLVLPGRIVEQGSIAIEKDRILSISSDEESPVSASAHDLAGLTVFPGFIDAHIHGAVGVERWKRLSMIWPPFHTFFPLKA
jgi:N-acetylglucosamine-6-phosphate deacetylase